MHLTPGFVTQYPGRSRDIPSASGPPGRRTGAARWLPCNSLRLEDYRHSDKQIDILPVSQSWLSVL